MIIINNDINEGKRSFRRGIFVVPKFSHTSFCLAERASESERERKRSHDRCRHHHYETKTLIKSVIMHCQLVQRTMSSSVSSFIIGSSVAL